MVAGCGKGAVIEEIILSATINLNRSAPRRGPCPGRDPARPAGVRRDPQSAADRISEGGAAARGALTLDGLGMLVYQGAIAFKLWTGVDADVAVMRRALEQVFG